MLNTTLCGASFTVLQSINLNNEATNVGTKLTVVSNVPMKGFTWIKNHLQTVLGYLKDSNVVAHSVYSDIFYPGIRLPSHSKPYISVYFWKSSVKSWGATKSKILGNPSHLKWYSVWALDWFTYVAHWNPGEKGWGLNSVTSLRCLGRNAL